MDYDIGFWLLFFVPDSMKDKYKGKAVDSVVRMVKELPDRNIPCTCGTKRTYVVVMDNSFTYSSTLVRCREEGWVCLVQKDTCK